MDTTTTQRGIRRSVYLRHLRGCNNLELYIQPDPFTGRDVGHLHRPLTDVPPQGVLSIDFGKQTNLLEVQRLERHAAADLRDRRVASISRHGRRSRPSRRSSTELPMGLEPTLFADPAAADRADRPARMRRQSDRGAIARAGARLGDEPGGPRATGEVDGIKFGGPLRAGLPVLVRGAGRQNSGLYYVTSPSRIGSRATTTARVSPPGAMPSG